MSKRVMSLLQTAVWIMLFVSPLTYINHGNGMSLQQFLMLSVSTLTMMVVFYVNYFYMIPRYYVKGEKRFYWLTNATLCIGLGISLHLWMNNAPRTFGSIPSDWEEPNIMQKAFFSMRHIFNLIVTVGVAMAIQFSIRWHRSEEARREAVVARKEAELRNLRNQISPHFLLNTLNNIYALTAFDSQRAQEAIQELSKMLRHMLYDNQQQLVKWDDEVQFLKSYVALMKIRLPKTVDVTITAQQSSQTAAAVAPLLFISLVENAFKHGVSPTEPSFIHIHLEADEQKIVCEIENSNHPKNQEDRSGHGIGLQQVQHRLDLSYPEHYTWEKGVSEDGKIYKSKITISL